MKCTGGKPKNASRAMPAGKPRNTPPDRTGSRKFRELPRLFGTILRLNNDLALSVAGSTTLPTDPETLQSGSLTTLFGRRVLFLVLLLGFEGLLIFVHIRDYYRDSIARAGL